MDHFPDGPLHAAGAFAGAGAGRDHGPGGRLYWRTGAPGGAGPSAVRAGGRPPGAADYAGEIERLQRQLEEENEAALSDGIAERTEAYISDKAASMGLAGCTDCP